MFRKTGSIGDILVQNAKVFIRNICKTHDILNLKLGIFCLDSKDVKFELQFVKLGFLKLVDMI